jgi:hypothetical protein
MSKKSKSDRALVREINDFIAKKLPNSVLAGLRIATAKTWGKSAVGMASRAELIKRFKTTPDRAKWTEVVASLGINPIRMPDSLARDFGPLIKKGFAEFEDIALKEDEEALAALQAEQLPQLPGEEPLPPLPPPPGTRRPRKARKRKTPVIQVTEDELRVMPPEQKERLARMLKEQEREQMEIEQLGRRKGTPDEEKEEEKESEDEEKEEDEEKDEEKDEERDPPPIQEVPRMTTKQKAVRLREERIKLEQAKKRALEISRRIVEKRKKVTPRPILLSDEQSSSSMATKERKKDTKKIVKEREAREAPGPPPGRGNDIQARDDVVMPTGVGLGFEQPRMIHEVVEVPDFRIPGGLSPIPDEEIFPHPEGEEEGHEPIEHVADSLDFLRQQHGGIPGSVVVRPLRDAPVLSSITPSEDATGVPGITPPGDASELPLPPLPANDEIADKAGWLNWRTAFDTMKNPDLLRVLMNRYPTEYVRLSATLGQLAATGTANPLSLLIQSGEALYRFISDYQQSGEDEMTEADMTPQQRLARRAYALAKNALKSELKDVHAAMGTAGKDMVKELIRGQFATQSISDIDRREAQFARSKMSLSELHNQITWNDPGPWSTLVEDKQTDLNAEHGEVYHLPTPDNVVEYSRHHMPRRLRYLAEPIFDIRTTHMTQDDMLGDDNDIFTTINGSTPDNIERLAIVPPARVNVW